VREILVPTTDVNDDRGVLIEWKAASGSEVRAGQAIADFETSKAAFEVTAPCDGVLLQLVEAGATFELATPIALIGGAAEVAARRSVKPEGSPGEAGHATVKARQRAAELGVDLSAIGVPGLITVKHVEEAAARLRPTAMGPLPDPLDAAGFERVVLIGGARAAMQVIDIFRRRDLQRAVAVLDDDDSKWGGDVYGVPVCGGTDRLRALFDAKQIDAAIVAISTSVAARRKFRLLCEELRIPLTNAIDDTVRASSDAVFGRGNVICAFCHFGTGTVVGDNNFISAYNSFDHHNVLGNDISTGPGCMTSGRVRIGDRCRLGTGIFIEPRLSLGEEVRVASGAVIVKDVPARHTVKTKVVTTSVVPNR
jgi:acetyltransferase-like isoleucine patch superfamily enzyme